VVIPLCLFYIFILHIIQSAQHITMIMFTVKCFDSKRSSSGYVRTIYVYKVNVRILQNAHSYLLNMYGSNIAC